MSDTRHTERLTATPEGIRRAAELLKAGKLVAFGTETVYGLGAIASSDTAVARIFAAKGRPRFNPLISHLPDAESAFAQASLSGRMEEIAHALAKRFWPGPLTMVLPRSPNSTVSDLAAAGLSTLALRVPRGKTALALLREVGAPVAAPSANVSGTVSPSDAFHVLRSLDGRIDAVLDSGPCSIGVESTVLDLTREVPVLLRPGGVTLEDLTELCGPIRHPDDFSEIAPASPGRLASHYAPNLPVRLDAASIAPDEAQLAFGTPLPGAGLTWNLSESGNLEEAAARLFAGLRFLDAEGTRRGLKAIAAQPIPRHGLGLAIRDRLRRAAEPRTHNATLT
ncbi:L-threonylcarbamoyladenylate synthase [Gluconobacter sphaericus]|uniref:Threonylcarbamoyl-AMP synthase n=1 Tax=Gluconobacter sphaericus NBRC 12467 TaxID=1307951 RepID=A0AA37SJE4_9PROT|nr:L-threonylcarbamoyladenylate synthase [Gluconobacter sphaericus]MBF0885655.1 threonylcarbamoyl-AMP synthase [Gluconobacter sphaericus]MBS1085558.1 threonylcarbamoyl-AMP synthase [Gluconobacter sphaericus]MBS1097425.1 threonylcarbamoyl-AMP synthase [Gluconobacter sphaericus]MBS1099354.1 threonylcarbamoyl-AMP synthase [Gluconobacter sphaericus]GBR54487.1 translation modulator Sua5/YciO/YrdC/YwlC [Gluconobacter sphaericus NBRC 12467]